MKITDIIHKISDVITNETMWDLPARVTYTWNLASLNILCGLLHEYADIESGVHATVDEFRHTCNIAYIIIGNHTIFHDGELDQAEIDTLLDEYEYLEI